jgi:hypothetical protein
MELEQVRLAAALAHTVSDAALSLTYADGTVLSVSFGPGSDLDPCSLRSLVGAAIESPADRWTDQVVSIGFAGSLSPVGGGVYRRRGEQGRECLFATTLCPYAVQRVLAECEVPIPSDRIEVSVRCDAALGVSVGVVRVPESDLAYLEDVAVRAQAACLVEELVSTGSTGE